jgi:hypothetical protein
MTKGYIPIIHPFRSKCIPLNGTSLISHYNPPLIFHDIPIIMSYIIILYPYSTTIFWRVKLHVGVSIANPPWGLSPAAQELLMLGFNE